MKTKLIIASLFLVSGTKAVNPVTTHTFVDPCTPFVQVLGITGMPGCYSFTATNGTLPGHPPGEYTWNFGDGITAGGARVAHCYDPWILTTTFTGTVTYQDSLCGTPPVSTTFVITLPPPPAGTCVVSSPEVVQSVRSVTVKGGISIPELMRSFNFGDGSGYNSDPTHTYAGCGPYVITIKSWDMNTPDDVCYAYHAVNFVCKDLTTAVSEFKSVCSKVFPNPCGEKLFIESNKPVSRITVTDVLGKTLVLNAEGVGNTMGIDTGNLDHGLFLVKIEYLDNTTGLYRIMKN